MELLQKENILLGIIEGEVCFFETMTTIKGS